MSDKAKRKRSFETIGGYPAGSKPLSEVKPPPKGPAAGAKPSSEKSK